MNKINFILRYLHKEYETADTSLDHITGFQMLIATMLSAQATDVSVNKISKDLFNRFPSPEYFAKASVSEIQKYIKSINYYKTKSMNIKKCSELLITKFNSKIPDSMEELLELPGVGRKTANVVLGVIFNKSEGVVVDTHVSRISYRLGLSNHKGNSLKIEQDLIKLIPNNERIFYGHSLVYHGRKICDSRKPLCKECGLAKICEKKGVLLDK